MAEYIEIDGVKYTEKEIRIALAIEKDVRTPGFFRRVLGDEFVDFCNKYSLQGDF